MQYADDDSDGSYELDSSEEDNQNERQLLPSNNRGDLSLYKSVPLITRAGQCKGPTYDIIMGKLEFLQDNGKWIEFDMLSQTMMSNFNGDKKDLQCVIMIEKGVSAYYKNDLETSKQLFTDALQLVGKTDNSVMLQGRAYYLLANVYRHEKKLGKAQELLETSEQLLYMHENSEDKAELYYTYGNFLLECMSMAAQPSVAAFRQVKEYFEKELQFAMTCRDKRVKMKKMRYAFLKIAQLLLDCRNQSGRGRHVSVDDVLEAKSCLDQIELDLWENMAFGTKIQFYLARSDQFYRMGNYTRALELAELALSMIHERGFYKQVNKAEERILHLQQFIRIAEIPVDDFVPRLLQMTDESGHTADMDTDTTDSEAVTHHDVWKRDRCDVTEEL